jgi:hypothetical protein
MSRSPLALLLVLAGATLVIGAPLLFSVAPASTVWTDADQAEYQKAAADFHSATYEAPQHKGSSPTRDGSSYDPVAAKQKYEAAKAAYARQEARLLVARSRPFWITTGLRVIGLALLCVGVYGHFTWQARTSTRATGSGLFQTELATARAAQANHQASQLAGMRRPAKRHQEAGDQFDSN